MYTIRHSHTPLELLCTEELDNYGAMFTVVFLFEFSLGAAHITAA